MNDVELIWQGKQEMIKNLSDKTDKKLLEEKKKSVDWDNTNNLYIEGDNLEVLKLLKEKYKNKIDVIYIDPPYNTGKNFIYNDKIGVHSNWLNFMYSRLWLAKQLLSDNGVIFISIDDNEQVHLKELCDEIFGEENFVGNYIKRSKIGGGNDTKYIVKEHEYCLVYCKNILKLEDMYIPHDKNYLKRYKEEDENGKYFWDTFARPGLKNPIIYDIEAPDGTIIHNGWIRSKDRFNKDYNNGEVRIIKTSTGEWSVQFKQYLNDKGKKPRSYTMNFGKTSDGSNELKQLFNGKKLFSYPKSSIFIKQLLISVNNKNLIVLDFFSGSGTTADAVMQLNAEDGGNRKFIMVQLPEKIDEKQEAYKEGYRYITEIGEERIRRAGKKVKEEHPEVDTGFRVYSIGGE